MNRTILIPEVGAPYNEPLVSAVICQCSNCGANESNIFFSEKEGKYVCRKCWTKGEYEDFHENIY